MSPALAGRLSTTAPPGKPKGWILSKEADIGILDATVSSGLCYALGGDKPGFSRVQNYAMSSDIHNANPKARFIV